MTRIQLTSGFTTYTTEPVQTGERSPPYGQDPPRYLDLHQAQDLSEPPPPPSTLVNAAGGGGRQW